MNGPGSIFLEFNLPNATTWFYFSFLLAVALFFKFSRLLSIRNWDVVTLFLLVPGLLLLLEARDAAAPEHPAGLRVFGYASLLGGSGYFLLRCLADLALVRRPALGPNLNQAGLAWLGLALFVSLVAVAVRQPTERYERPAATPAPVRQVQEQVETQGERLGSQGYDAVDRGLTILCHLAVVAGLVLVGCRHFQDLHAGVAAATFYLLLPYAFLLLPGNSLGFGHWHHVLPMTFLVWAVAAYRAPAVAGLLVGLAAGTTYFPALVFPIWFGFYRRRGAGRFAAVFLLVAGLSLALAAGVLWFQGHLESSVRSAVELADWQAWKQPRTESIWSHVHWAYRLPVFIAYVAFLAVTAVWPSPKNLAHVLALSAAAFIGIQFWYSDRGGTYILWYLPFLLLLVFRPNLSDRVPPPVSEANGRLGRLWGRVRGWAAQQIRAPSRPVSVR